MKEFVMSDPAVSFAVASIIFFGFGLWVAYMILKGFVNGLRAEALRYKEGLAIYIHYCAFGTTPHTWDTCNQSEWLRKAEVYVRQRQLSAERRKLVELKQRLEAD